MSLNRDIASIIVTYNKQDLLRRCIESLAKSSVRPGTIIVVDNNSIPKVTHEFLADLVDEDVKLIVENLNVNIGGAGGFSTGLKIAENFEGIKYYHLLDDDGYVDSKQLEVFMSIVDPEIPPVVLNALVLDINQNEMLSFGLSDDIRNLSDIPVNTMRIENLANPFNGTLIDRRIIAEIGGVRSDFFIWGDEQDFYYRVIKAGFAFDTVTTAFHYHPSSKTTWKRIAGLSFEVKPAKLEHIFLRNRRFILRNYFKRREFIKFIVKYAFYSIYTGRLSLLKYVLLPWNPKK